MTRCSRERTNCCKGKRRLPLSQIYLLRKQQFSCRVATAEDDDPIRTVTCQDNTTRPRIFEPRRIGRPKVRWAHTEAKKLWEKAQEGTYPAEKYNPRSIEQGNLIRGLALSLLKNKTGMVHP